MDGVNVASIFSSVLRPNHYFHEYLLKKQFSSSLLLNATA